MRRLRENWRCEEIGPIYRTPRGKAIRAHPRDHA
jgi:hypothetical protein